MSLHRIWQIVARAGFASLMIWFTSASYVGAQSYRGTIRGQIRDASGAAIPAATVVAKNLATSASRTAAAAADGGYVIPELAAGEYEVTATASGLAAVTQKAIVEVGTDTALDFVLAKAAPIAQQVTVEAVAPLVDTQRDVLGGVVESRLVDELPLNGRDFGKLVALVPGATVEGSGVAGTEKGFGQFNINGARDRSNNYMVDGADNNDPFHNNSALNQVGITGAPASLLPLEAIQEFNLEGQFPAEYGRNSGSVVNIITKSGGNQLHGSLFEYHRNSFFDARNFFNVKPNPQTLFINNQYGGSLGGPVIRDKTFFFGAYEGQRERVGSDFNFFIPTTTQINNAITDATTFATLHGFTINTVPTRAILTKFFPANNTASNLVPGSVRDKNSLDNFLLKLDHHISESEAFAVRYAFGQSDQTFPLGSLGGFGAGSRLPAFAQTSPTRVQLVSASLLSTLGSDRINEVRFGYTRFRTSFSSLDASFDPGSVGLNFGTGKTGLPEFDFAGLIENLGATAFSIPRGRTSNGYQFLDNYTWIRGVHTFKFGGEYRRVAIPNFNDNLERGLLQFFPTGLDTDPVTDLLASYFLGGNGSEFVVADSGDTHRTTYNNGLAFFGQDDYRVRQNLTLNLGLRWEYFGPLSELHNLLSNIPANIRTTGVLQMVGTPGLGGVYTRDLNDFGPHIGLAWSPLSRTVVRANYGVYYDYIPQDMQVANFTTSAGVATNPIGPKPVVQLIFPSGFSASAFNGSATGFIFTFSTTGPFSIFVTDHDLRTPYMQTWNLNIQRELSAALAFEAGYVGSKGTKLVRLYDANQDFTNSNYSSIDVFSSGANSTYHALQLSSRFRQWHRFSGFTAYVFSKSLDGASDGIDFNFATAAFPQNSDNLRAEKGPSTFDTRHRFTAALNYQLPVLEALPKRLGQGWQLNSIVTAQSGRPIGIITSNDTSGTFNFHQRPNVVPGVKPTLSGSPANGYINPLAFSQPPSGTFGNLGRDQIYGPKFVNWDFSLTKDTAITEQLKVQFRAEFFNILNHPDFALPSGVISPAGGTGLTLSQALAACPGCFSTQTPDVAQGNPGLGGGGPRVLQFALRLQF